MAQTFTQFIRNLKFRLLSFVQVAANAAVALLWRLPPLQGLMARNFTHLPGSGRCRTLLTSVFSHRGALHLTVGTILARRFCESCQKQ